MTQPGTASMPSTYKLTVCLEFQAAHQIIGYQGKCARLHGHNYRAGFEVTAHQLNQLDIAIDSVDIKQAAKQIIEQLDHHNLNELEFFAGMNPTAETIAEFLFHQVAKKINNNTVQLTAVTLWETDDFWVRFEP